MSVRVPAGTTRRRRCGATGGRSARGGRRAGGPATSWRCVPNDPAHDRGRPAARPCVPVVPAPAGISGRLGPEPRHGRRGRHHRLGHRLRPSRPRLARSSRRTTTTARPAGTGDEVGHGTHVSGLACGAPDNGFGIAGGGLDCQIVLEKSDLTSSSVIASLVDAARLGAGVINMSFGGGRLSAGEYRALQLCAAQGRRADRGGRGRRRSPSRAIPPRTCSRRAPAATSRRAGASS